MRKRIAREKFIEYLKSKGLKLTKQRKELLEEVLDYEGHFEIEDIVHKIKNKNLPISRATVYRTLNLLKDLGIITEVIKYNNRTIYELSLKDHHDHLICRKCGKIIEFSEEEIENLQNKICEEYGFKPEMHRLEIYGLCKECINSNGQA